MADGARSSYEHYRDAVYARLGRYTFALDNPDDRVVAIVARAELPRYVRYWIALLAEHEATASGSVHPVPDGGAQSPRRAACGSGHMRS